MDIQMRVLGHLVSCTIIGVIRIYRLWLTGNRKQREKRLDLPEDPPLDIFTIS